MSNTLQIGMTLAGGKYTIVSVLGRGTFGITYKATMQVDVAGDLGNLKTTLNVAIKEFFMNEMNSRGEGSIKVEGTDSSLVQNYRRKFRKEAENLSKLSHPNIVHVLEIFDENNTTYYVMEYVDGESLDGYIARCGALSEVEATGIIKSVGNALQYMHENRMLHLDLKPANVMRRKDGHVVLIDFGLSKQYDSNGEPESSTSLGLGTQGYAPIEQSDYRQDGTFPATLDIYALGATFYKMLTGERPPAASTMLRPEDFPVQTLRDCGVSESTIFTLQQAMAPSKRDRFQSVSFFVQALEMTAGTHVNNEVEVEPMEPVIPDFSPEASPVQEVSEPSPVIEGPEMSPIVDAHEPTSPVLSDSTPNANESTTYGSGVDDNNPSVQQFDPSKVATPLMQEDATVIGNNNQITSEKEPKKRKKILLWIVIALVAIFVLLLVIGLAAGNKDSEEFIDSAKVDTAVVDSSLTVEALDLDVVLDKPVVIEMVDQSVDIPPEYRNVYMEIDSLLIKTAGKCTVTIVSYCNALEADSANSNLSRSRAEKFKERLIAAGVDSSIITLKKYVKSNKNQLVITVSKAANNVNRPTPARVNRPVRTNNNRNEVGSKTTNPNRRTTPTRTTRSINGESGR